MRLNDMNRYYQVLLKKIVASIFLFFAFFYAGVAAAQSCSYAAGAMRPVKYMIPRVGSPPNTLPFNQTQFTVTGNESVGTVLWNSQLITGDGTSSVSCGGPLKAVGLSVNTIAIAGYNVIRSNIPGIGIVLVNYDGIPSQGYASYPSSAHPDWHKHSTNFALYGVKLIRIPGQLSPGTIAISPSSSLLATLLVGDNRLPFAEFYYALSSFTEGGGGGGTCLISAGDINKSVSLPSVKISDFPSVGSTAGETRFRITAEKCSQGLQSVRFTFNGTPASGNSQYFANTGSASGVALRLKQLNGVVVTPTGLAASATASVTPSRRLARLDLTADYVRTGPMGAGNLRSIATVTMSYP